MHCLVVRSPFKFRKKYAVIGIIILCVGDLFGFFAHMFEEEFDKNFQYPYEGDISSFVAKLRLGLKPEVDPINTYNYSYLYSNSEKCKDSDELRLVYVVKSSVENFERRKVIRKTWGFEKRFSDVKIRRVFVLGIALDDTLQELIDEEYEEYQDIIQVGFLDTYFNNTIKTMSGFKWVIEFCPNSRYYFFSDDDMYISTKNVLRFLRNPTNYPQYIELEDSEFKSNNLKTDSEWTKMMKAKIRHSYSYDLPKNVTLYTGYVFMSSPQRHKFSKWYISLREYPYNMWPPYVTAGAYILSKEALVKLYYASLYTKHFRFDDIYLGLVALKAGIEPFHCSYFHFYKKPYNSLNYKYLIASHGYDDVTELERVWNEQKEAGNA